MPGLRPLGAYQVHHNGCDSLVFFPHGDRLLSAAHEWIEEEEDVAGVLNLWRPEQETHTLRDLECGGQASLAPDGTLLAWGGLNGQVRLFSGETFQELAPIQAADEERTVDPLRITPDAKVLLVGVASTLGEDNGKVTAWDTASWRPLYTLPTGWVMSFALSPDGRTLAVGQVNGGLQLWDLPSRRCLAAVPAHTTQVVSVAFDPSGRLLATAGMSESLRFWDIAGGQPVARSALPPGLGNGVNVVAFLPTGELITGDEAGHISLWDAQAGAIMAHYSSNAGFLNLELVEEEDQVTLQSVKAPEVTALAVSNDGRRVAAGNLKGGVQIWAVEPGA